MSSRRSVRRRSYSSQRRQVAFEICEPRRVLANWQNPLHRLDVSDDGVIAPLDALLVINELNATGVANLAGKPILNQHYFDTSGDDMLAPLDALEVINYLNSTGGLTSIPLALVNDAGASSTDRVTNDIRTGGQVPAALPPGTLLGRVNRDQVFSIVVGPSGDFSIPDQYLDGAVDGAVSIGVAYTTATRVVGLTRMTVTLDRVAPLAPQLSLSADTDSGASATDGITNVVHPKLQALTEPGSNVEFVLNSQSLGQSRADLGVARLQTGDLAEGAHEFRVRVTDIAGNTSALSSPAHFSIDVTPPEVPETQLTPSTDSGARGDGITHVSRITLTGVASAHTLVSIATPAFSGLADASGRFQIPGVTLLPGPNNLAVQIVDVAGNVGSRSIQVFLDASEAVEDPVLAWNKTALEAIRLTASSPPYASRALAMLHLAVLDALASIEDAPSYLVRLPAPANASLEAAIASASHKVLTYLFAKQTPYLDQQLASALSEIPAGASRDAGVDFGRQVAQAVIAIRASDGWLDFVEDTPGDQPGQWRGTAPMYDIGAYAQWADLAPFAMSTPSQFRTAGPPALSSAAYAADYNDVRTLGKSNSTVRTADQTQIARFWADGAGTYTPPGHWNEIASQLSDSQDTGIAASARLFAMLNVALADAAIASWDVKYQYDFWRPITAIADAALDGNTATAPEADWAPLLITPSFPEYVSGHSTFSGAAAAILGDFFGEAVPFTTTSLGLPGVQRHFNSFEHAAQEAGRSRIYGGIHFEFSNQAGLQLGRSVADEVALRFAAGQDVVAPRVLLDSVPAVATSNLTLTGQVFDNLAGVATLEVQWKDDIAFAPGEEEEEGDLELPWMPVVIDAAGRFTVTSNLSLTGTSDGLQFVRFRSTDALGNTSTTSEIFFHLDTQAPALEIFGPLEGEILLSDATLAGKADGTASTLQSLAYSLDGGASMPIAFDVEGRFSVPLDLSQLSAGNHTLTVTVRDAAGLTTTQTLNVSLPQRIPLTIIDTLPLPGATEVGTTYRPQLFFSRPIDPASLNANNFYATDPLGNRLAANIVPAGDGSFAWLFFANPMPGSTQITVHVVGDSILAAADSQPLDADEDGVAGGTLSFSFQTVSLNPVAGTTLRGKVVDPGVDLKPMTFDDMRAGPDGIAFSADDVFLNPLAGVKVFILGMESQFVLTDAAGNFELPSVPVGNVKLALDGRTATGISPEIYFPEMVMDLYLLPGEVNTVMGTMGTAAEREAHRQRYEVYLPRIQTAILETVSSTQTTIIGVNELSAPDLTPEQRQWLKIEVQPNSMVGPDGTLVTGDDAKVGVSTVPPELVRDMLPPGIMQHTFDITVQAPNAATFTLPARMTFPNVFHAAPGSKLNFLSFDHTTGRLEIEGTATVSEDGLTVVTDPDTGITKPGWHGLAPPGTTAKSNGSITEIGDCGQEDEELKDVCPVTVRGKRGDVIDVSLYDLGFRELEFKTAPSTQSTATPGFVAAIDEWQKKLKEEGIFHYVPTKTSPAEFHLKGKTSTGEELKDILIKIKVSDGYSKFTLGGSVGDSGVNKDIDVFRVQQRLKYFNYRGEKTSQSQASPPEITVNGNANAVLTQAIKLFQAAIQSDGLGRPQNKDGKVSVGATTSQWLNAKNAPKWVDLADSSVLDAGDINYETWATSWTEKYVNAAATSSSVTSLTEYPDKDWDGSGPNKPHAEHFSGNSVDEGFNNNFPTADSVPFTLQQLQSSTKEQLLAILSERGQQIVGSIINYHAAAGDQWNVVYVGATADDYQRIRQVLNAYGINNTFKPGHNNHFHVRFNAPEIEHFPEEPSGEDGDTPISTAPSFGTDSKLYYHIQGDTGVAITGRSDANGVLEVFLAPNAFYTATFYQASTNTWTQYTIESANTGETTDFGTVVLDQFGGPDADQDGIPDEGERAIGTRADRGDSDGDGLSDALELTQGSDPLNGRGLPTGVVGSAALQGDAREVALLSGNDSLQRIAVVATGEYGLAVIDVTNFTEPEVLTELDLPGVAVDVASDPASSRVAVALSEGGLAIIDLSDLLQPVIERVIPAQATQVEIVGGTLYATIAGELQSFDWETGAVLRTLTASSTSIVGMRAQGSVLFTLDANGVFQAVQTSGTKLQARSSLRLNYALPRFMAGGNVAYLPMGNGFATIDISNPDMLRLISGPDATNIAGTSIAVNGGGVGVAVGSLAGIGNVLHVVNVSDPGNTAAFAVQYPLPGIPQSVAIASGLAFVASTAGLQVVNYLPFDNGGVPPVVTLSTTQQDLNPDAEFIQVLTGTLLRLDVQATDDVQVSSIELQVNGVVTSYDDSFPFDLAFLISGEVGAAYELKVRARDTGGNTSVSEPLYVTVVPDTFAPLLQRMTPNDQANRGTGLRRAQIDFNEPIAAASLNSATFRVVDSQGALVAGSSVSALNQQHSVQIAFDTLSPGTYQILIDSTAVLDVAGNPLGTGIITSTFTVQSGIVSWNNAEGGYWDDPANWDAGVLPGPNDAVVIDVPATAAIVLRSGTVEVKSLLSNNLFVLSGGTLKAAEGIQVNNLFRIEGGTIRDSKILPSTGGHTVAVAPSFFGSSTLQNVELLANLRIEGGSLIIVGGLILEGTLSIDATNQWGTSLVFQDSQTISGSGNILISGEGFAHISMYGYSESKPTIVIGSGIEIGGAANLYFGVSNATLINHGQLYVSGEGMSLQIYNYYYYYEGVFQNFGTVVASAGANLSLFGIDDVRGVAISGGGELYIEGNWRNTGVVSVTDATIHLDGLFKSSELGQLQLANAVVNITGTMDNTGNNFTFNSATGSWNLLGGKVVGGSLSFADNATLAVTPNLEDGVPSLYQNPSVLDGVELNGPITVQPGAILHLVGQWNNHATITADNATLGIGGEPIDMGVYSLAGGTLDLLKEFTVAEALAAAGNAAKIRVGSGATLDNTNNVLLLGDQMQWQLAGGTLRGGVISAAAPQTLSLLNQSTLDGVEVDEQVTLAIEGQLTVVHGLKLDGSLLATNYGYLDFVGEQTLSGSPTINLSSVGNTGYLYISSLNGTPGRLTLGEDVSLNGPLYIYGNELINQGTILNGITGATVTIAVSKFTNLGTLQAENGGNLAIHNVDAKGASIRGGGTLTLDGNWTNTGTITVEDSTLRLSGNYQLSDLGQFQFTNAQVILAGTLDLEGGSLPSIPGVTSWKLQGVLKNGTLDNSAPVVLDPNTHVVLDGIKIERSLTVTENAAITLRGSWQLNAPLINQGNLYVEGKYAWSKLAQYSSDGGTLHAHGEIQNAAQTLQISAASGAVRFESSTIVGGTLAISADADVRADYLTLDAVSLTGQLTSRGSLFIRNGLELNGTLRVVESGYVTATGIQTIGGTGTLHFANTTGTTYLSLGENYYYDSTPSKLTLGPQITLRADGNTMVQGQNYYGQKELILQGAITADGPTGNLSLNVSKLTNQGTITATNGASLSLANMDAAGVAISGGGQLQLTGTWSNTGTVTVTGSTLVVGGAFTIEKLGQVNSTDATIIIGGSLDLAGEELVLDQPDVQWQLRNATVFNGTLTVPNGGALAVLPGTITLQDLTLNAGLTVPENTHLYFRGDWTHNGTLAIEEGSVHFGGELTSAKITGYQRTGGEVYIEGSLVDQTLDLNSATGPWILHGANIQGGTITVAADAALVVEYATLDGVVVNGDLSVSDSGELSIVNGLQLHGELHVHNGYLRGLGTQTISGTGEIRFTGTFGYWYLDGANGYWDSNPATLTLGSGLTLDVQTQLTFTSYYYYERGLTNEGTIHVAANKSLAITATAFTQAGQLTAAAGAKIRIEAGFDAAGLSIPIGATVTLAGAWSNSGVLTLDGGRLVLFDNFTLARLGTLEGAGQVEIGGTLDLEGATWLLDGTARSWGVRGGTIINGTLATANGAQFRILPGEAQGAIATSTLQDVIVETDLVVPARTQLALQGEWQFPGQLNIAGGDVLFGGEITRDDIPAYQRSSGRVLITGVFDNTAQVLTLDDTTGSWILTGEIIGGSITTAGSAKFLVEDGTLDGVQLDTDVQVQGLNVENGIEINGILEFVAGYLYTTGTQLWQGTGSVLFNGGYSWELQGAGGYYDSTPATVTIGAGLSLDIEETAYISSSYYGNIELVVQGDLAFTADNRNLTLEIDRLTLNSIEFTSGSRLTVNADWDAAGMTVPESAILRLGPAAHNSGTLTVEGTLELAGAKTWDELGTLAAGTGEIVILGTLDLDGNTLALDASSGAWKLNGNLANGVLTTSPGVSLLVSSYGVLDGMTLQGRVKAANTTLTIQGEFDNQGTIEAPSASINIYGAPTNLGNLELGNSRIYIYGTLKTSQLKALDLSTSTVYLYGTLDNVDDTLEMDSIAVWRMQQGTIKGGTIAATSDKKLVIEYAYSQILFEGVTLSGPVQIQPTATLTVKDGLTLADADIEVDGVLLVSGNLTISGAGELILKEDGVVRLQQLGGYWSDGDATLTIGSGITVQATSESSGIFRYGAYGTRQVVNQGVIEAAGLGATLRVDMPLSNTGVLRATPGASLIADADTAISGRLELDASSRLEVNANLTLSPTAVIDVELAAPPAEPVIVVNGELAIDGTLNVALGFAAELDQSLPIVAFDSVTGDNFDVVNANVPDGLAATVVVLPESAALLIGEALLAGIVGSDTQASGLADDDLQSVASAAIERWQRVGLSQTGLDYLASLQFRSANLGGNLLGFHTGRTVFLDTNAANHGWFIDSTPADDAEYAFDGDDHGVAAAAEARGRVDLLTVILHEMGHALGAEDESALELMSGQLAAGERIAIGSAETDEILSLWDKE